MRATPFSVRSASDDPRLFVLYRDLDPAQGGWLAECMPASDKPHRLLIALHCSLAPDGRAVHEFCAPFRDGITHFIFEALTFIERLAALVDPFFCMHERCSAVSLKADGIKLLFWRIERLRGAIRGRLRP